MLAHALSGPLAGLEAGPAFTATGSSMTVLFRSDRQTSMRGFSATYSCGGQCLEIECCATGGICTDLFDEAFCECNAGAFPSRVVD